MDSSSLLFIVFICVNAVMIAVNIFLIGFLFAKIGALPTANEVIKGIMETKIPLTVPPEMMNNMGMMPPNQPANKKDVTYFG